MITQIIQQIVKVVDTVQEIVSYFGIMYRKTDKRIWFGFFCGQLSMVALMITIFYYVLAVLAAR